MTKPGAAPYVIDVKTVSEQPILSAHAQSTLETLAATIGTLLSEVGAHAASTGAVFAGMPFTRYPQIEPEIEVEAGMPVLRPVEGGGRVQAGMLPAGEVAVTLHVGPYSRLPEAAAALLEWAESAGREPAGLIRETYLNDPAAEPDPANWRTEVTLPLRAR